MKFKECPDSGAHLEPGEQCDCKREDASDAATTPQFSTGVSPDSSFTQCDRILRHFKDYGSITSLEAMQEYGIMRLASRISDLKRLGYVISVATENGKNRYGEKTSYARYSLKEVPNGLE